MESMNYPLSNMQLELLKLFSRDIEDKDVREIKSLIVKYLAGKLSDSANRTWEDKQWSNEDMDRLLNTHMRTPYEGQDK